MNLAELLDEYLLNQTKRISGKLYRSCGIHHMTVAKFLLSLSWTMASFCLTIFTIVNIPSFNSFFGPIMIYVSGKFMMFIWKCIVKNHVNTKPGTLNVSRKELQGFRFIMMVISIFLFTQTVVQCFYAETLLWLVLIIIFSPGLHLLLFASALYFGSIESEPPSESKLKKLIGALRNYLSSAAIPQPA